MKQKDAFQLLFGEVFESGPLFKNQSQLAAELISHPASAFYTEGDSGKQLNRLKAYLSQLFSEGSRRSLPESFVRSLSAILADKNLTVQQVDELMALIVEDLKGRNTKKKTLVGLHADQQVQLNRFFIGLQKASYVSVFTSREIQLGSTNRNYTVSFIHLLMEDIFSSIEQQNFSKRYKFNFPLKQTCVLFWRTLEFHVQDYMANNQQVADRLPYFWGGSENQSSPNLQNNIGDVSLVTRNLLQHFSDQRIVTVFLLEAPIYLAPTVTFDPADQQQSSTYVFFQNSEGNDTMHRLTEREFFGWKQFVFDHLRTYNSGLNVPYSPSPL